MLILENGKPFPDTRYRNQDGLAIVPTETSFFLLAVVPQLTRDEIVAWSKGHLRYGIFVSAGVPFILLDFPTPGLTLDAPFNARKLDPAMAEKWATENTDQNLIHMVLVEKTNYVVRAQRAIGAQPELVAFLKAAAAAQLVSGDSQRTIDARTDLIYRTFTTADMMSAGKIWTL